MGLSLIYGLALYLLVSPLMASGLTTRLAATSPSTNTVTPVGKWKTVDDRTGKVRAIVAIWEENGKLNGKIERLLDPQLIDQNPQCINCIGDLKDKPVIGMRILWDLTKDGDKWAGGKVLDPENGRSYRCIVAMQESGKILKVRGFIGFSLFGRTQYWQRDQ